MHECLLSSSPVLALEPPRPVKSLLEMRHDRVTIQNWDLSCGAAALTTILNYAYDDPVSERDIAKALIARDRYVDNPGLVRAREGFSLLDLKRYVDARGYRGIGYGKLKLDHLIERAPIIIPIRSNGYSHFVVFRGGQGNRILLAEPHPFSFGLRKPRVTRRKPRHNTKTAAKRGSAEYLEKIGKRHPAQTLSFVGAKGDVTEEPVMSQWTKPLTR